MRAPRKELQQTAGCWIGAHKADLKSYIFISAYKNIYKFSTGKIDT